MSTVQRNRKVGGTNEFETEFSLGFTDIRASEVDADFNTLVNAWNTQIPNAVVSAGLPPGGVASGDLTGTYPNPTIAAGAVTGSKIANQTIQTVNYALSSIADAHIISVAWGKITGAPAGQGVPEAPTDGQQYARQSAAWSVVTGGGGTSGPAGGDLTGTYPNPTIGATKVTRAKTATDLWLPPIPVAGDVGKVLSVAAGPTLSYATPAGGAPSGAAGGDLTGTYPNPTIGTGKVLRAALTSTLAASIPPMPVDPTDTGKVATVSGGITVWATPAGGAPSGPAGGDLSGTYPNPTIAAASKSKWTDTGTAVTPITSTRQLVIPGPTSGTDQALQILGTRAQKLRVTAQPAFDIASISINEYYNGTTYVPDVPGAQGWVMALNTMNSPSPNVKFTFYDSNTPQNAWNALWFDYGGTLTIASAVAYKQTGTAWANPSDRRIKDDIADYTTGLSAILQLMPRTFLYNGLGGSMAGLRGYGFIADEVETAMPEMVGSYSTKEADEDIEYATVDQSNLILALVNAVKELSTRVTTLEAA